MIADVGSGLAHQVWQSPYTDRGSFPDVAGDANLAWGAGDRIVFLNELDGWPHLYSVPAAGGEPMLLTTGKYMVEHVTVSPDHRFIVFSANTGPDANDDDRRHIFRVPVDPPQVTTLTRGDGVEWTPVITGDITQIDLPREQPSGLIQVRDILREVDGIEVVEFGHEDVVRHKLVQRIVEAYKRHAEETGTARQK